MKFVLGAASTFALLAGVSTAFVQSPSSTSTQTLSSSTSRLYNIPPPSTKDKEAYQAYANKQAPPASFFELQQDCIRSAQLGIEDGELLLEVEFPPLPANVLELDDVSAYDVASANLNLAMEFCRGFTSTKRVAILYPDQDEARIAVERLTGKKDEVIPPVVEVGGDVIISSLRRSDKDGDRLIKVS